MNAAMNPTRALETLKDAIDIRRASLLKNAEARRRGKRNVAIACGVIALLSGTGMTAVLSPALDSASLKIVSAILAFLSGLLNIVLTNLFDDKETRRMDDGAGQLLAAQLQIEYFLLSRDMAPQQIQEFYGKISDTCVKIFNGIDSFIPYEQHATTQTVRSPRS
jgi:hypothetical protein